MNHLEVGNAATGTGVDITTAGSDASVDLLLVAKGTGVVKAEGNPVVVETRTISTATGLDGGGDLSSNRTIDFDLNALTADGSPDAAADYVVTYDASASAHRKVVLQDIATSGLLEDGTNVIFEDDEAFIVGAGAASSYVAGAGAGDHRVADDFEVVDVAYFAIELKEQHASLFVTEDATHDGSVTVGRGDAITTGGRLSLFGDDAAGTPGSALLYTDPDVGSIDIRARGAGTTVRLYAEDGAGADTFLEVNTGGVSIISASGDLLDLDGGMKLRLQGSTSGHVDLVAPAAPTSWTLTVPEDDGAAGEFLRTDGSGGTEWASASKPDLEVFRDGAGMYCARDSACARLNRRDDTIDQYVILFDDSVDQHRGGKFRVPGDVDTGGTVEFSCKVEPVTHVADDVILGVNTFASTTDEAIDGSWTTHASAATTMSATADVATDVEWQVTVSTLTWSAGDTVQFEFFRDADNLADDLAGDLRLYECLITIPRA